jgi:NAD(P)-dependent dehydrogenase (short-subunit alcohol dehydrogenase family)
MELGITGKVAVVTGASKGIGLAVADALAREGVLVVAGARGSSAELAALGREFDVDAVAVDLASPQGPADLVRRAVERHGGIDLLVNNVGAGSPRPGFLAVDDDEWQRVLDVTFLSAVRTSRAAIPAMLARGGGAIVNVSSINARLPFPMVVDYSAAKAALTNLTKALSEEFAPQGIRVNAVSPGPVRTPFWTAPGGFADTVAAASGTTAQAAMDEVVPASMAISTGRVSEAREVADLVLFLASERAANVTGSEYAIDGGQLKTT